MFRPEKPYRIRRVVRVAFRFFLCFLVLLSSAPSALARDYIIVLKSREAEPYDIALKSLRRTLRDKGADAQIEEILLPEEGQARDDRLAEIRKKNPQLFVTLGSAATAQLSKVVKETPVVFCMALNPLASGFIRSMNSSGNNLTGASLDIPAQVQFEALRSIVPTARKLGVVYNPQETEVVVSQAKKAAKEIGLDLIGAPVASGEKVPEALRSLEKSVDALWSVADGTAFSAGSMENFFLHTLRNKIPFMGLSPAFVKAGALMALSVDYQKVGAQCGGLASKVLAGEFPWTLPITIPQKVTLHVNLKTAETIGLKIPANRLKGAIVIR